MDAKEFLESRNINVENVRLSFQSTERLLTEYADLFKPEFEPGEEVEVKNPESSYWVKAYFVGYLKGLKVRNIVVEDHFYNLRSYATIRKINPTRNAAIEEIKSIAEKNNIKIEIKE